MNRLYRTICLAGYAVLVYLTSCVAVRSIKALWLIRSELLLFFFNIARPPSGLSGPAGLAVHHGRLYWTEESAPGGGAGAVRARDIDDGAAEPETLTRPLSHLEHVMMLEVRPAG